MDKASLSALQSIYDESGLDALRRELLRIARKDELSQKDAEALSKSFFDITAGGGERLDPSSAGFLEFAHQKFPKSKILKNHLVDIYSELANNGFDEYIARVEKLVGKKPETENAAIMKAQTLSGRYYKELHYDGEEPDWEKCTKNVDKIEEIYDFYPQSEHLALLFTDALLGLTLKQEAEECKTTIRRLEKLFEQAKSNQFPKISWFAARLADGLYHLSTKQNEEERRKTIAEIEKIVAEFPDKDLVVLQLGYALKDFGQQARGKEREEIIRRLMEISSVWAPAAKIAREIQEQEA